LLVKHLSVLQLNYQSRRVLLRVSVKIRRVRDE
jgi:hypothetical protein